MDEAKSEREISTIAFPYVDLETAETMARVILNAGAVALSREQLAGLMNTNTTSGTFLMKLSAARMFGLIETRAQNKFELTQLGFEILDKDEARQKAARKEAFLKVPLFQKAYAEYRGKMLPSRPLGLEMAFVSFGVSSKQKSAARLTFDKSAAQAGFFAAGNDKLVEPIIATGVGRAAGESTAQAVGVAVTENLSPRDAVDATVTRALHPFVKGLIDALPKAGDDWSAADRVKWLRAAANNFDLMYKGEGEITIVEAKATPQKHLFPIPPNATRVHVQQARRTLDIDEEEDTQL